MTVNTDSQSYCIRRKGGRSLLEYPPLFSVDGQSLLVICENTVRVYTIKTGECSRVLEPETRREEAGELIAIRFVPEEPHNLYGCSARGHITVWSWEVGGGVLREKIMDLASNEHTVEINEDRLKNRIKILTFDMLEVNACLVSAQVRGTRKPILAKYCLKTNKLLCDYRTDMEYSKIWQVAIGCNKTDKFAVICDGSHYLYCYDFSKPKEDCKILINLNKVRVICVSAHPVESCIVTGDALGRAIVWKGNLVGEDREWGREILHWHTLPVFAVNFSPVGGYLITGGLERVVVKWHLGSLANAPQQRETLPRLPGAIRHLAVSVPHIAIATNTNAIVITTAQLRVVSTITECGGLSSKARALGCGLVYQPSMGALLLGGRTGHLQLLSTATDELLYNIDITGVNMIPATRHCPDPIDLEVTCAAVSADGKWLITSEYRCDETNYPEERLKFWIFKTNNQSPVKLNTVVNLSHGGCSVNSIVINNTSDYAVTAGTDQKFRIWKRELSLVNKTRKIFWSCLTACYYSPGVGASLDQSLLKKIDTDKPKNTFDPPYLRQQNDDFISEFLGVSESKTLNNDVGNIRKREAIEAELELGGIAVSQDGSLIAAWFGSRLTLWDSHTCSLRTVLSHPSLRPKGVHVVFGNDDAAHYLVCSAGDCVAVWSLLSLSVRWLVHARVAALAADPFSNRIAIFTQDNDVFIFTPHSAQPLLTRRRVLDPSAGVVSHCVFGPSAHNQYRLLFMRNHKEVYTLEPVEATQAPLEAVSRVTLPVSNFGALVAGQHTSEVKRRGAAAPDPLLGAPVAMFSAASHMVPSTSLLCTPFLQQLAGITASEDQDEAEPMMVDSSSEEESEEPEIKARTTPKKVEFWKVDYGGVDEKQIRRIVKKKLSPDVVQSLIGCKI